MKRFFIRLHYLITNPGAFVLSYTAEPVSAVLKYFLMVLVVMVSSTAMIRTQKVMTNMPQAVGKIFKGVTLEDGKLRSENGSFSLKQWEFEEVLSIMNGRSLAPELYPESLVVVDPEGETETLFLMKEDSLVVTVALTADTTKAPYRLTVSWERLFQTKDLAFTATGFDSFLRENRLNLFTVMLVAQFNLWGQDMISYVLMLWILILIYRRELAHVWIKKSTVRILLNGMLPYLVLMPMFAVAGNRSDLLSPIAIVVAAVIISRAFRHHRLSIFTVKKEQGQDQ